MDSPKYYILKYELGDGSGDGHDKRESGYIKVNHSNEELKNAMKVFVQKTGCAWENWCEECDENVISPAETMKIMEYIGEQAKNFETENGKYHGYADEDKLLWLDPSSFVALMMAICRVALPDLDWSWHTPHCDGEAFFNDMGYGLF